MEARDEASVEDSFLSMDLHPWARRRRNVMLPHHASSATCQAIPMRLMSTPTGDGSGTISTATTRDSTRIVPSSMAAFQEDSDVNSILKAAIGKGSGSITFTGASRLSIIPTLPTGIGIP